MVKVILEQELKLEEYQEIIPADLNVLVAMFIRWSVVAMPKAVTGL